MPDAHVSGVIEHAFLLNKHSTYARPTIKSAAVESDITGRLISATAWTIKVQIAWNIHQLTWIVNVEFFVKKPTGTAAYLPNDRRLISARPSQTSAGLNERRFNVMSWEIALMENSVQSWR